MSQLPPNKALQRRPRSTVLISIGISHAAPLNGSVRRLMAYHWLRSGCRNGTGESFDRTRRSKWLKSANRKKVESVSERFTQHYSSVYRRYCLNTTLWELISKQTRTSMSQRWERFSHG